MNIYCVLRRNVQMNLFRQRVDTLKSNEEGLCYQYTCFDTFFPRKGEILRNVGSFLPFKADYIILGGICIPNLKKTYLLTSSQCNKS